MPSRAPKRTDRLERSGRRAALRDPGDCGSQCQEQANGRRTGATDRLDLLHWPGDETGEPASRTHAVGADLDGLDNGAQTQIAERSSRMARPRAKSPLLSPRFALAGPYEPAVPRHSAGNGDGRESVRRHPPEKDSWLVVPGRNSVLDPWPLARGRGSTNR